MKQRYLATLIAVICSGLALPVLAQNVPVANGPITLTDTASISNTMQTYNVISPIVKLGDVPKSTASSSGAPSFLNPTGTGGVSDPGQANSAGNIAGFTQAVSGQSGANGGGLSQVFSSGVNNTMGGMAGGLPSGLGSMTNMAGIPGMPNMAGVSGLTNMAGVGGLGGVANGSATSGFSLENMARVAQGLGGVVGGQYGTAAVGLGGAVSAYNNCSDITVGCATGIATMAAGLYSTLHPESSTASTVARLAGVVNGSGVIQSVAGLQANRIIGESDAQYQLRMQQTRQNVTGGAGANFASRLPIGTTVYNGPSSDAGSYTNGSATQGNVYTLPDGTTFTASNQAQTNGSVVNGYSTNPGLASWLQNQPVSAVGGSVDVVPMNPGVVQPGSNTGFDAWMRNQPVSIPVSQDSNPISLSQPVRATTTMFAPDLSAANPVLQQLAAQQSASMVSAMQAQRNAVAQYGAGSPEAKGMMDSVNMLSAVSGRQYAQAVEMEKARAANQNTALLAQQQFSANTAANANLYASVAPYSVEPTVPQSFIAVSNNIPVKEPVSYTTPGIKTSPWGVPVTGTADGNNPPGAD